MASRLAAGFSPLALALLAPAGAAQSIQVQNATGPNPAPKTGVGTTVALDTPWTVEGTVKDLSRDSLGRILFCTAERTVGRLQPGKVKVEVLADAASGPFPNELRGVAETPTGDVVTVDLHGHVRALPGGAAPAVLRYSDLYMIANATDIVVDARGSYLITSQTPSSGQRGINWIGANGQNWGYYMVKNQPVRLAHDPLTGNLLVVDSNGGGKVHMVDSTDLHRPITLVDGATLPGIAAFQTDGDVATEADGDYYWSVGGTVYFRDRANGTTGVFADGYEQLRGAVIAPSTGWQWSATGWSLYLAEGQNPTRIRELPGVGAPGAVLLNDQGAVPGRGQLINVIFGFNAFCMAADNDGKLLIGGSFWNFPAYVKRIDPAVPSITTIAASANGLADTIEGLAVAPDDTIYALARNGTIHAITEGPLNVTDVFTDPLNQITAGKDLALDVNGTLYVGTRESWDFGKVMAVSGGSASLLTTTEETRGLAARPTGGMYVTQWHDTGFHGTVDLFHFDDMSLETLPGFSTMNYTNDVAWGDGDIAVNVQGSVFTVSEDDWSLVRWDPWAGAFVRYASGYLNHPSGLVIAQSTPASGSSTGWSLYVAEWNNLWELPGTLAPASTLVDSSLGLTVDRTLAGVAHPNFGMPTTIGPAPGGGILVGTEDGWLLNLEPDGGQAEPLAGPEDGLAGVVAVSRHRDSALALDEQGRLFQVRGERVREVPIDPERAARVLERVLRDPRRSLRLATGHRPAGEWFALDGWAVWRVGEDR